MDHQVGTFGWPESIPRQLRLDAERCQSWPFARDPSPLAPPTSCHYNAASQPSCTASDSWTRHFGDCSNSASASLFTRLSLAFIVTTQSDLGAHRLLG